VFSRSYGRGCLFTSSTAHQPHFREPVQDQFQSITATPYFTVLLNGKESARRPCEYNDNITGRTTVLQPVCRSIEKWERFKEWGMHGYMHYVHVWVTEAGAENKVSTRVREDQREGHGNYDASV